MLSLQRQTNEMPLAKATIFSGTRKGVMGFRSHSWAWKCHRVELAALQLMPVTMENLLLTYVNPNGSEGPVHLFCEIPEEK